ncbi:M24 family metallopeptidase [Candidatus Poseidonia sp.]|nr:M24 family metallopeptidase [Poseidonia sp.]
MTAWSPDDIVGPEGEDWRVPVSELATRQARLGEMLKQAGLPGVLVQHPVDLYYYTGGRQDGSFFVPALGEGGSLDSGGDGPVAFVRRSLKRAQWEAGGDDAAHHVRAFPRLSTFAETLRTMGVTKAPALQFGEAPGSFTARFASALSSLGEAGDATAIIHRQREVKSAWEIEQMETAAAVQYRMFEAVLTVGGEGVSELDMVAAAEAVSRSEGFGGNVQMRRYPLQCDRGVIVAGRAGGIPSFFDSAVGGTGPHPLSGMGSGFSRVKANEPVLVDLVHAHRGYMVDCTRMFVAGRLDETWEKRLDDMVTVKEVVVDVLDQGRPCSEAWEDGLLMAETLGYGDHLMGTTPDQSRFLGHSIGLQLDESPVVAAGFDRPLPVGGTMAIEPKVVYGEGSVGTEDTWLRDEEGMRPLTADGALPWLMEWDA